MPFPWMAAATLGAGGLAFLGAKSANRASARSAREQMEFQENMSNTSYQRVMADMRAAGLNPILAGKLGGASAPPGAGYAAQNEASAAASTAIDIARTKAEIENMKTMNEKIKSDIDLNKVQQAVGAANALFLTNSAKSVQSQDEVNKANVAKILVDASNAKELGKKLEVVGGPAEDLAQGYKKFKGWINSDNHPVKKLGFGSWLYDVLHPENAKYFSKKPYVNFIDKSKR